MTFDSSFWVLVSFLLFVGLLFWFRVPSRVLEALDKRAAGIGRELDEARELRQEAQNMLASWNLRQKQAEAEKEEIVAQAGREAERLLAEARTAMAVQAERQRKMNEARIRQAGLRAEAELRGVAVEAAVRAVRAVLREGASVPDDAALEADFQALAQALPKNLNRIRAL